MIPEVVDTKIEKWKIIVFHSFFVALFAMAFLFFKERLYSDSAYYIAHTIDSGFFFVQLQRYVLAFAELVPLIALIFGGGLKTILIFYSIGHVLFFYGIFLIVLYRYNDESAAILLIILQTIGTIWLFFSPMYEICYGAAFLVLFYVMLKQKHLSSINWFIIVLLEILVLTSHPENIILFIYILTYDIFRSGYNKKRHLLFFILVIATLVFKSIMLGAYESGKINFMLDFNQNQFYQNLLKRDYLQGLWQLFTEYFPELIVMAVLIVVNLFKRKSFSLLGFFGITVIGLIALINATNYARDFGRYSEMLYSPLVLLISLTFITEVWMMMNRKWKNIIMLTFCIVIINRIQIIAKQGRYLNMRIGQMENIISSAHNVGISKCIVRLENSEIGKWALNWSYPMESILISSINSPDSTVSITTDEDWDELDKTITLTNQDFMFRRWEIRKDNSMTKYFKIKNGKYVSLNTSDSSVMKSENFKGKISVQVNDKLIRSFYSRYFLPVLIKNDSGKILHSGLNDSCFIYCRSLSRDNSVEIKLPLDIDVHSGYLQYVNYPALDLKEEISMLIQLKIRDEVIAETVVNFANPGYFGFLK